MLSFCRRWLWGERNDSAGSCGWCVKRYGKTRINRGPRTLPNWMWPKLSVDHMGEIKIVAVVHWERALQRCRPTINSAFVLCLRKLLLIIERWIMGSTQAVDRLYITFLTRVHNNYLMVMTFLFSFLTVQWLFTFSEHSIYLSMPRLNYISSWVSFQCWFFFYIMI